MHPIPPRTEDQDDAGRRERRRGAAALLLVLGLIWGAAAVLLVHGRAAALEASYAWAEVQSRTAAQALLRSFEAVKGLHDLVGMRQALLRLDDAPGVAAVEALLTATAREGRFGVVRSPSSAPMASSAGARRPAQPAPTWPTGRISASMPRAGSASSRSAGR